MKILFIRHGDPDYKNDSLTDTGWAETEALAQYMAGDDGIGYEIDQFFCSPLGRARDTASLTLRALSRKAEIIDIFREFDERIIEPREGRTTICWDFYPADWTKEEKAYDVRTWLDVPLIRQFPNIEAYYHKVMNQFDALLEENGYVREGNFYRAVKPNHKVIAIFCHFGVTCMILSHLLNISPYLLLHGMFIPPTGLTLVQSEERDPGVAYFRSLFMGATPHLALDHQPISASGMYQESREDSFRRIGVMYSLKEVAPEGRPDEKIRLSD